MPTKPNRRLSVLSFILSVAAGCTSSQPGDFAASKLGDLDHPLAERRAPDEAEVAACGDGALAADFVASVSRRPYLQRVTDREVRIRWTAKTADLAEIALTTPDGEPVATDQRPTAILAAALVEGGEAADGAVTYESIATGLQPDTIYCYAVQLGGTPAMARAGFRTAPAAGTGQMVSFVALGDSGAGGEDQLAVRDQMGTVPFRLMLHTGDIAYDNGSLADFEGKFFGVYTDLVRSFAMFPTIGNHDSSSVFQVVFDLPRSGTRNWYSFDYGDVHFVALDTNDLGAEQAAWLDADLADTDRPWKIVYGHHPPYSSGSKHGSSLDVRNLFGPILAAHEVDLVLSGHDHNYERIEPQDGVSYIVTGGGGKGTRPVGTSAFTAFSEQVLHFVYVEIERDQLLVHAIDGDGTEFDQLAIAH
jgi:hypothetical protein